MSCCLVYVYDSPYITKQTRYTERKRFASQTERHHSTCTIAFGNTLAWMNKFLNISFPTEMWAAFPGGKSCIKMRTLCTEILSKSYKCNIGAIKCILRLFSGYHGNIFSLESIQNNYGPDRRDCFIQWTSCSTLNCVCLLINFYQLDTTWSNLGRRSLKWEITGPVGLSVSSFLWLVWVGPIHFWAGITQVVEQASRQYSPSFLIHVPACRFLSWVPALASINSGLWHGYIKQISPPYPKLLWIMMFITATESN